ncbi:CocE/NonD family hydrolase [uncultured Roseobacter sp.]|uniref:alpha/beta hydrolase n=1 Tax=uncultured Roseobacter sp. TaxID=114847 RepID=UPI00261A5F7F|nr:CocE/NonD family hydrolase [uncultured Roseobacter sp.]
MKRFTLTAAATLMTTSALADIETRTFTFENEGAVLSGTLYLPENHDGSALPTVLVTGSWTSVEEQMPALYAAEMVERGFAAVTFDFRGWGKSGNLPASTPGGMRFIENPTAKISDINAAAQFIGTFPEVDAAQINGMGICASAGYMADAAVGNPLIQSVGLVAPWLQDRAIVETVYGGADGIDGLMQVAAEAEAQGGHVIHAAYAEGSLMQASDYYSSFDRGLIAAYDNKWNHAGWDDWLTYLPVDTASFLDQPLAIVHSRAAAIPQGVDAYLAGYTGEATVTWLENVTQSDFYDNPEDVDRAADAMARHFAAQPDRDS